MENNNNRGAHHRSATGTATATARYNVRQQDQNNNNNNNQQQQQQQQITTTTTLSSRRIVWLMCCILFCFLIAGILIIRYPSFIRHNTHNAIAGEIVVKLDPNNIITVPLQPKKETIFGIDHYYMFPSTPPPDPNIYANANASASANASANANANANANTNNNNVTTTIPIEPKGILIYLHSCKQSGIDFFTLPEHRIIAHDIIYNKGLVVFAPSSYNRQSGCFTTDDLKSKNSNNMKGRYSLQKVVEEFIRKHKQQLRKLPIVGMGDSSGGGFLFFVYGSLNLQSMAIYNSPQGYVTTNNDANFNIINNYNNNKIMPPIPTVFLTMSSDISISTKMENNTIMLQEMDIPTQLFKVTTGRPFTNSLCDGRFSELPYEFCQRIFEIIDKDCTSSGSSSSHQFIDIDGYIIDGNDIKNSEQWQHCFEKILDSSDYNYWLHTVSRGMPSSSSGGGEKEDETTMTMEQQSSLWLRIILEKEIQTCYGYHAITAQYHDEILKFLMLNSNIKISIDDDDDDTTTTTTTTDGSSVIENSVEKDEEEETSTSPATRKYTKKRKRNHDE